MKCPLFIMATSNIVKPVANPDTDCIKEKCEVWNTELQQCDPTGLLGSVIELIATLERLIEKMPHAGQSTK